MCWSGHVLPLIAGLYYWLPHLSGRMPSERLGKPGFWLTFIGFNATFLLMHLTGLLGMPRRVYTYEAGVGWDWLNLLSSVGSFIMAAGIALIILDVALHFRFGRKAPRNPWQADTLEWATDTPAAPYNFISLPDVQTRHPLWDHPDLPESMAAGKHGLAQANHGRRETYGSDAITGRIRDVIHLPGNSWLPLFASLCLAVVCISLLVRLYPVALLGVLGAAVFLLRWGWENGAHPKAAPVCADEPSQPPLHSRTCDGPGRWGMVVTLLANGTLYLCLLFGWFYLWTASPHWSAPQVSPVSLTVMVLAGLLLTGVVATYYRIVHRLTAGDDAGLGPRLWGLTALGAAHWVVLLYATLSAPLAVTEQSHDAMLLVMLMYLLFHGLVATILTALQAWRVRLGWVNRALPYEPVVLRPFWGYTLGIYWLSVVVFLLVPLTWGGAA